MKQVLLAGLLGLICYTSTAQEKNKHYFNLSAGQSNHGTNDLKGFYFSTEFGQSLYKNLTLSLGLSATMHDGIILGIFGYDPRTNSQIDLSVRATTAGFQLTPALGFRFLDKHRHRLGIQAGPMLRLQSSSASDLYTAINDRDVYPEPLVQQRNESPQRSLALGLNTKLYYHFTVYKQWFVGAEISFQTDSHSDQITQIGFASGLRF